MSKIELETEAKELKATISTLTAILKTEESIKAKVSEELSDIEKKYASPRRTRLVA
jgi:DNA gyrase/topoisomerase IV subunit A